MTPNEIRSFSQPTWELYRESVLSIPGNKEFDVEGKPVYDVYHQRVMAGDYGDVSIIFIKDKTQEVKEQIEMLKLQIYRYIFATEDDPDSPGWEDIIDKISPLIGPILLENDLIIKEDLQYYKDNIDWAATLNDVIAMLDLEEKIVFYNCVIKN